MEEQFILRVPPSVAERLNRLLNEDPASPSDNVIDLSFLGQAVNLVPITLSCVRSSVQNVVSDLIVEFPRVLDDSFIEFHPICFGRMFFFVFVLKASGVVY